MIAALRARRRELALLAASLALALALLEFGVMILVKRGILNSPEPSYDFANVGSEFWAEINPDFGVWHRPGSRYHHKKTCFDVRYEANSYGARDPERAERSAAKRVVVLGDSMAEGWGVPLGKRMSDLLEKATGLAHLNFGTAGNFGPTQYYVMYKTLAKKFDHEAVVIALFPSNDFSDDDFEYAQVNHADQYRPYWVGSYPGYKLVHFRGRLEKSAGQRWRELDLFRLVKAYLREFTYTYPAFSEVYRGVLLPRLSRAAAAGPREAVPEEAEARDRYDKFTDAEFDRMRWSIEKIVEEARRDKPREVLILTLPGKTDFAAGARPRLREKLTALSRRLNVRYLDLLPAIQAAGKGSFYSCDIHWSEQGHAAAARAVLDSWPFYGRRGSSRSK